MGFRRHHHNDAGYRGRCITEPGDDSDAFEGEDACARIADAAAVYLMLMVAAALEVFGVVEI